MSEKRSGEAKLTVEEVTELVVGQLRRRKGHNDIVPLVCQALGCNWEEGQRFVARVARAEAGNLDRQTQMMAVPLSIIFIFGGIGILGGLWISLDTVAVAAKNDGGRSLYFLLRALSNPAMMNPAILSGVWLLLLTGVGLILGGIAGLLQAGWQILKNKS
ncbi:MAG TPA: hypothetical protein VLL52_10620 [Anaerolineae bacterium]|nr:hypothetical protein [Anaerolineae bacterium]